jgi:nitronate monooxygenase
MRTPLCERLGIDIPIIQAPMAGGWTTPALVAAVAEAGGLGTLAGARITPAELRGQIEETRRRTDRPFGVNFLLAPTTLPQADDPSAAAALQEIRRRLGVPAEASAAPPPVSVAEGIEIALAARVPVISVAMGSPAPWIERVHAGGAIMMAAATTVAEAEAIEAAGADAVVAQGAEAGGHRSTFVADPFDPLPLVGTMALVPAVVDAVRVPVVAAGGIMDGRGVVAALALGAAAAQLGTRFLLATESGAPRSYRRRLLRAIETETAVTDVYSGRAARGLRNAFIRAFTEAGVQPLGWPRQGAAALDIYRASLADDGEWAPLFAGQGVRLGRREQPAGEIVRELVEEARRVRERLPS